jgi:hypothetical protein
MIAAIVFAHVWGVLQVIALGSLSRTVRIRTALAALAAGLYACAAAAVLLEFAWIKPATWITGAPLSSIVQTASYTVDPFIEELVKLTPLMLLLLAVRVVRRQWSITDCVIVGAALGSGFGLAEEMYWSSAASANAVWSGGGWIVQSGLAGFNTVPGPLTTLTSWLPDGVHWVSWASTFPSVNLHLCYSAVGGFALGLHMHHSGTRARRTGIALFLYIGFNHALTNAALQVSSGAVQVLNSILQTLAPLLPLVALAVAWWLDKKRQSTNLIPELALAEEKKTSPPAVGTLRTAFSQAPWSVAWVDAFARMRRAYAAERQEICESVDLLRTLIVTFRDLIDRAVAKPIPSTVSTGWMRARGVAILRQPAVLVGLVIIMPSVLWFVVGGFPGTAWLQGVLLSAPAWAAIRLLSAFALAWTAWNVVRGLRLWVQIARWPLADVPATFVLRLLAGAGTLALGGYASFVSITHGSPQGHMINVHISGQVSKLTPWLGQLLASSGPLLSDAGISAPEQNTASGDPPSGPPTLRTPYAPPGTPEPPPFVPDIPVVKGPGPPGPGIPDPLPEGPVTLPNPIPEGFFPQPSAVPAEVAATTAVLPWLVAAAAGAAVLTYSSPASPSWDDELKMLAESRKIQQQREHR